jgi:hypothetical protein
MIAGRQTCWWKVAVILALGMTLVLVGCGGGDPQPLSKSAFLKQANAACVKVDHEMESTSKDFAGEASGSRQEELEGYVAEVLAPSVEQMTSELGGLGAPKGDEKKVERITTSFTEDLEHLEDEPEAMLKDDPFKGSKKMAAQYGLTSCDV